MKEELKKYLIENHSDEMYYGYSQEGWMNIIDKFFDEYQPERSKRKDSYAEILKDVREIPIPSCINKQ